MTNVFIDGSAGTTGLRIHERLRQREDIHLITLTEPLRKDTDARKDALNRADVAFLCLPDAAAVQAVELLDNPDTVLIDTSTAHRTKAGWTYGFPEIGNRRQQIKNAKRIANPGCHASGFIALIAPLVENGILDKKTALTCFSLTGYSGGGKKMIADYEADGKGALIAPRLYGLNQQHKHLPEMAAVCGLENTPVFSPIVSSFYSGMEVVVPLFTAQLRATAEEIRALYRRYYTGPIIRFSDDPDDGGMASAAALAGRDDMQISVFGNDERITLVSRFDNLGKGASGAAIQNMNIVLGTEETTGLVTGGIS